jgi:hypothetical protein
MPRVKLNEASLKALRLPELQAKYAEIVGAPTRCPNKAWLIRNLLEATSTRATSTKPSASRKADVEELQARHLEIIGRPTGSSHVGYLRWRLRQAERGRIRAGAEARMPRVDDDIVLPLRMRASVVARLDEARRRLGLPSRAELFRRALHRYFVESGERDVAALFVRGEDAAEAPVSNARS